MLARLAKFAQELEKNAIDEKLVQSKLTDENFTDLVEEGLRQATRSLSDDRRKYLASVISNSIESNDIEIIWLRYYLVPTIRGDEKFREKHKHIIDTIHAVI